jgi:hypothetical protein
MSDLFLAGIVTLVTVAAWAFLLSFRKEKTLSETMLVFNLAHNVEASSDLREKLPNVARVAQDELPSVRRALIEDVAQKYGQTPEALEAAILADTGAHSLDEALRGSSSVEDMLLAETQDPIRLFARRVVQKSREQRWIRSLASLFLPATIILTLVALALLGTCLRVYWS